MEGDNFFTSVDHTIENLQSVLNAIGLTPDEIEGAIRFSLSDLNTKEEIMQTVEVLKESVSDLRMIIGRRR